MSTILGVTVFCAFGWAFFVWLGHRRLKAAITQSNEIAEAVHRGFDERVEALRRDVIQSIHSMPRETLRRRFEALETSYVRQLEAAIAIVPEPFRREVHDDFAHRMALRIRFAWESLDVTHKTVAGPRSGTD